jgi:hypothetical protein
MNQINEKFSSINKMSQSKKTKKGGNKSKFKCDAFTKLNVSEVSIDSQKPNKVELTCAPGKEYVDGSCFTLKVLIEMARAYNATNPQNPIKDGNIDNERAYRKYLLIEIAKRFETLCTDQRCWLAQDFIKLMKPNEKNEAVKDTIRPHGPGGQFKWLGTTNIDNVMKQYEQAYDDFYFFGAVPADFDKWDDIGNRQVPYKGIPSEYIESMLLKGKKRFGIVFNTDESNKSGQHWISAYADATTGIIAFFDSVSDPPGSRIRSLLSRFKTVFKKHNIEPIYKENNAKFQYKDTECGVYSINFILRMLDDGNFDEIVANPIDDATVNKCRVVYFGGKL